MVLKGLDNYNQYTLSHEIGTEYLDSVVSVFKDRNTLFEHYAPEFFNGKAAPGKTASPDFVGWTGIVPISILFEYVFGIKPHAECNKISWHVELLERHGVEQYPFGKDGELSLFCEAREDANDIPKITVSSNVPVEIEIVWGKSGEKKSMILRK